jgi:pyrroloquinoline quinone biosynthesis protein E
VIPPPLSLIAELTHACPLRCLYCSNPLALVDRASEMDSSQWRQLIREAAALGVLHLHLSGGEPLLRSDLEALVAEAACCEVYTNLITSGVGLGPERAAALAAAGLRHVQISFQADAPAAGDMVAGRRAHAAKLAAARAVRDAGLALTLNAVIHRHNIDRLEGIIDLSIRLGAQRLELANVQFYGWALLNRRGLMPSAEQVSAAEVVYRRRKAELDGRVELIWVLPDYHEPYPKSCMGGWGRQSLTVAPDGRALPCPAASSIASLQFDNVQERSLRWVWEASGAFNAFRGTAWMPQPCRSCDRRFIDGAGCRCQAYALTGDAARTDPVCRWAPDHDLVVAALAEAEPEALGSLGLSAHIQANELAYRSMTSPSASAENGK